MEVDVTEYQGRCGFYFLSVKDLPIPFDWYFLTLFFQSLSNLHQIALFELLDFLIYSVTSVLHFIQLFVCEALLHSAFLLSLLNSMFHQEISWTFCFFKRKFCSYAANIVCYIVMANKCTNICMFIQGIRRSWFFFRIFHISVRK